MHALAFSNERLTTCVLSQNSMTLPDLFCFSAQFPSTLHISFKFYSQCVLMFFFGAVVFPFSLPHRGTWTNFFSLIPTIAFLAFFHLIPVPFFLIDSVRLLHHLPLLSVTFSQSFSLFCLRSLFSSLVVFTLELQGHVSSRSLTVIHVRKYEDVQWPEHQLVRRDRNEKQHELWLVCLARWNHCNVCIFIWIQSCLRSAGWLYTHEIPFGNKENKLYVILVGFAPVLQRAKHAFICPLHREKEYDGLKLMRVSFVGCLWNYEIRVFVHWTPTRTMFDSQ